MWIAVPILDNKSTCRITTALNNVLKLIDKLLVSFNANYSDQWNGAREELSIKGRYVWLYHVLAIGSFLLYKFCDRKDDLWVLQRIVLIGVQAYCIVVSKVHLISDEASSLT